MLLACRRPVFSPSRRTIAPSEADPDDTLGFSAHSGVLVGRESGVWSVYSLEKAEAKQVY